jgi:hypothetical protein
VYRKYLLFFFGVQLQVYSSGKCSSKEKMTAATTRSDTKNQSRRVQSKPNVILNLSLRLTANVTEMNDSIGLRWNLTKFLAAPHDAMRANPAMLDDPSELRIPVTTTHPDFHDAGALPCIEEHIHQKKTVCD